jgi:hypothetical protein
MEKSPNLEPNTPPTPIEAPKAGVVFIDASQRELEELARIQGLTPKELRDILAVTRPNSLSHAISTEELKT